MKMPSSKAMAGFLTALVVTVASCTLLFDAWKEIEADACVGSGSQTAWLGMCAPACLSTNWCDDLNNNLRQLDAKFAPSHGAGAHYHTGVAGEGAKIPPDALDTSNSASNGLCLTYVLATDQFEWGSCSTTSLSADYAWTGLHEWSLSTTDENRFYFFGTSGVKDAAYTAHRITDSSTGVAAVTKRVLNLSTTGSWGGAVIALTLNPGNFGTAQEFLEMIDPISGFSGTFEFFADESWTEGHGWYWPDKTGRVKVENIFAEATTVADNGAGTNASATITPIGNVHVITCNDTQGCDITLGETDVNNARETTFISIAASGHVFFTDVAGVQELGSDIELCQYDTITFKYNESGLAQWVETARSTRCTLLQTFDGIFNHQEYSELFTALGIDAVGDSIDPSGKSYVVLTSDANYTLTSTPTILDGTTGQLLEINGVDGADCVTFQDNNALAGSNLALGAASRQICEGDVLGLRYNPQLGEWLERYFTDN